MKTLMVQGTSSGAGKSTLVTALCRIFSDRGFSVAPYKSQNMSNFSYRGKDFEISRAQAVQAVGARTEITPDMNPILLKPRGNYYSTVYLNGRRFKKMHARDYYSGFVRSRGIGIAMDAIKRLQKSHDLLIIEGAGSPTEINLQKFDIANMLIAERTKSPVILVTDIDRGGAFASIVGTMALLNERHRGLVRGFVFNKFRGDAEILRPGFTKLRRITKKKVFGVIPKIKMDIPEEDSLDPGRGAFAWNPRSIGRLDAEIDKLGRCVERALDIGALERLI